MKPLFFGTEDELFGCLHSPADIPARDVGIVLLYPAFGEYIQQHRAFYRLSEKLAERGFPCLRFDYFGTGDSSGTLAQATLGRWREDAFQAVAQLRRWTGARAVALVGSRLGALLAGQLASADPGIVALAMWDPVVRGRDLLHQLSAQHAKGLAPYLAGEELTPGVCDLLGFPVSESLWQEIAAATFDPSDLMVDQKLLVIGTLDTLSPLRMALDSALSQVWFKEAGVPCGWLAPAGGIYDVLVPLDLLRSTVDWIERYAV